MAFLAVMGAYHYFRARSLPVYKHVEIIRLPSGWQASVLVAYKGKDYLEEWFSKQGVYWHNDVTGQTAATGWAGGDQVADAIMLAFDQYLAREEASRIKTS